MKEKKQKNCAVTCSNRNFAPVSDDVMKTAAPKMIHGRFNVNFIMILV